MKYALIGCGRIAANHMKAAIANKLEIVAVCDVRPEAMESLLARYGLEGDRSIRRYQDHLQMLEKERPMLPETSREMCKRKEVFPKAPDQRNLSKSVCRCD